MAACAQDQREHRGVVRERARHRTAARPRARPRGPRILGDHQQSRRRRACARSSSSAASSACTPRRRMRGPSTAASISVSPARQSHPPASTSVPSRKHASSDGHGACAAARCAFGEQLVVACVDLLGEWAWPRAADANPCPHRVAVVAPRARRRRVRARAAAPNTRLDVARVARRRAPICRERIRSPSARTSPMRVLGQHREAIGRAREDRCAAEDIADARWRATAMPAARRSAEARAARGQAPARPHSLHAAARRPRRAAARPRRAARSRARANRACSALAVVRAPTLPRQEAARPAPQRAPARPPMRRGRRRCRRRRAPRCRIARGAGSRRGASSNCTAPASASAAMPGARRRAARHRPDGCIARLTRIICGIIPPQA